ncbi:DUF6046 domain-containing protein [Flavobacterium sp. UBA6046]|jgi:hypothetical protein|uniref:DUF6046 domain-containing protein n=1 Tax=Flavobacterium sp. UBA6046 TaxID=1946552 RepID=UPI0025C5D200|nr:DUF6046 domain-containing protein [Flavobacterium sp. UBA6046]
MSNIYDLQALYKSQFGFSAYHIKPKSEETPIERDIFYSIPLENPRPKGSIDYSSKNIALNKKGLYGQDIWFPIELWKSGRKIIEIEACTVGVNLVKEIIRTQVSERKGRVKECFAIDDYKFNIKGFLIGKNRLFPEDQIQYLKDWFETTEPIELHGGYPELFLDESCRVAITALDFPEVQGKAVWVRPFTMTVETDYIQDLILK